MTHTPSTSTAPHVGRQAGGVFRLWVDGVGAYLVCLDNQVRIGGAGRNSDDSAEISLLSNLSRHHARLIHSGEVWLLEPLGLSFVDAKPVTKHILLNDGNQLRLGSSVALRFRLPSPLSGTARLDFESDHRTQPAVDGVILIAETCVMGAGLDAHIPAPAGCERVLFIRRSTGLWCKASEAIQVDGTASGTEVPCEAGRVYAGPGWQFRLEFVR